MILNGQQVGQNNHPEQLQNPINAESSDCHRGRQVQYDRASE